MGVGGVQGWHTPVMLATDVAARVRRKDVTLVIITTSLLRWRIMHRIGRTGRAGAKGTARSMFAAGDARHARSLCGLLQTAGQPVPRELVQFLT